MFIASAITLIGAVCQASAEKRRDLIAGRIVLGVGTVMLGPSAQSWAVGECFLKSKTATDSDSRDHRDGTSCMERYHGWRVPVVLFLGNKYVIAAPPNSS